MAPTPARRRCPEHMATTAGGGQSSQAAQRGRAGSQDTGQASKAARGPTVPRVRSLRSMVSMANYGGGHAADARARGRVRSPSVEFASGSGVLGRRDRREQHEWVGSVQVSVYSGV